MRKMLKSKKGFSLVELMIVVVIMGILIAVAVPLYGAVTASSKNKSCASNVDGIRSTSRNYYLGYNAKIDSYDTIAASMEDKKMPTCPWHEGEEANGSYTVYPLDDGRTIVVCSQAGVDGHDPVDNDGTGATTGDKNVVTLPEGAVEVGKTPTV